MIWWDRGAIACAAVVGLLACSGDDDEGGGAGQSACMSGGVFGNVCPPDGAGSGTGTGAGAPGSAGGAADGTGAGGVPGGILPDGSCASGMAYGSRVTPTIHLVVDGSCSMELDLTSDEPYGTCDLEDLGTGTRWGALRNALVVPATGILPRFDQLVRFGFTLFGTQPNCPIVADPISPDVGRAQAITDAMPLTPPGSNTPTGLALQEVVNTIDQTLTSNPDAERSPQMILLATDGAPNSCDDSTIDFQPSLDAAMAARDLGITMYVLSLAPTTGDYATHLQEMADIGLGQPNAPLYTPASPEELASTLMQLVGGAIDCDVRLDGRVDPLRACDGQVFISGEPLECGVDWELVGADTVRLLGARCDAFKLDEGALLTARWPCGVFRPI